MTFEVIEMLDSKAYVIQHLFDQIGNNRCISSDLPSFWGALSFPSLPMSALPCTHWGTRPLD
jgi:hypothetical protein